MWFANFDFEHVSIDSPQRDNLAMINLHAACAEAKADTKLCQNTQNCKISRE